MHEISELTQHLNDKTTDSSKVGEKCTHGGFCDNIVC